MKKNLLLLIVVLSTLSLKAQNITRISDAIENTPRESWEVLRLTNIERVNNGLQIVVAIDKMQWMTHVRASETIRKFSHTRPTGQDCYSIMRECSFNYTYAAENIAKGQRDPAAVMNSWMNSPGHRANILNNQIRLIGVGMVNQSGTKYWVQMFANDRDTHARSASLSRDGQFVILELHNGMTAYVPNDPSIMINRGGRRVVNYPSSQDLELRTTEAHDSYGAEGGLREVTPEGSISPSGEQEQSDQSSSQRESLQRLIQTLRNK